MGAKICVLLNCGQQSQFSKVRREFDAGRVNLDPPMTCADWPVPGNLTLLHPQTAYTRKPLHRHLQVLYLSNSDNDFTQYLSNMNNTHSLYMEPVTEEEIIQLVTNAKRKNRKVMMI